MGRSSQDLLKIELIDHLAKLSRLNIKDKEKLRQDLEEILNAFKVIGRIDTKDVDPTYHPLGLCNVVRKDIPKKGKGQKLLDQTKNRYRSYFKGPKVMR